MWVLICTVLSVYFTCFCVNLWAWALRRCDYVCFLQDQNLTAWKYEPQVLCYKVSHYSWNWKWHPLAMADLMWNIVSCDFSQVFPESAVIKLTFSLFEWPKWLSAFSCSSTHTHTGKRSRLCKQKITGRDWLNVWRHVKLSLCNLPFGLSHTEKQFTLNIQSSLHIYFTYGHGVFFSPSLLLSCIQT